MRGIPARALFPTFPRHLPAAPAPRHTLGQVPQSSLSEPAGGEPSTTHGTRDLVAEGLDARRVRDNM